MAKSPVKEPENAGGFLRSVKGEVLPYRQVFDLLRAELPFAEAVVVTSLPRGGLQIVQPPRLPEPLVKDYTRELHSHDRLTWQAIATGGVVHAADAWPKGQLEQGPFAQHFMRRNGFAFAAAAPLSAPVLDGYPGAVHFYRDPTQGEFSSDELSKIAQFAEQLDQAIIRIRRTRHTPLCDEPQLAKRPPVKQFIINAKLEPALPKADTSVLDERLRENLLDDARQRMQQLNGSQFSADRVPLADSRGDLWNFRVVSHRSYPALADGPVIFFSLSPACGEWTVLRPADFQADSELSRLIPALRFMADQFHRGPTLVEIAKTVHLSPFHFHRRFTELLGITPKHFLLDCQIMQAKSDLLEGKKDLAQIATDCGFAHQSHFTSRFKQATGLTPTRWRRMAQDGSKSARSN
jgi:AraC-like DNA-binding protein